MSNVIDFINEERKLEGILDVLGKETLSYVEKRKQLRELILEARKKYLEEYKDDEDAVIDYFDHEDYVRDEAYKAIDKRLMEYTKLKESPYFGKVTFREDDHIPEEIYIGRYGMTIEQEDNPLIVDWRAPVASLFYKGSLGKAEYNIPDSKAEAEIIDRKQIIIKKSTLEGVFDSALDVKDEILQMVLTKNSSDKLKDIVMTIQKEQDEIIREDRNKVVVVNGVAGSGKTTIALHRISYLLYNFRKQFGDKVLIFGPNNIFMDYIAQVLPSLGESNIAETTFENFVKQELKIDEEVKELSSYVQDSMEGKDKELKEFRYKNSQEFIKFLDDKINELNMNYFNLQPVMFDGTEVVSINEIKELFDVYYKDMPLFRRSEKIRRILISKIKDKRDEEYYALLKEIKERKENMSEEEAAIESNDIEFHKAIKIREIIRKVMDSRESLDKWLKHESIIDIYKRVVPIDEFSSMDLTALLYFNIKLEGAKYKKEIKHIVIDEAQDYSFLQFEVIKQFTGCKSYTIVGDYNQKLIDKSEECAMMHLEDIFDDDSSGVKKFSLEKSYRSTQEIMEYANQFLNENKIVPLVRHGEEVMEEEAEGDEELIETIISILEDYEDDKCENIAIICKGKYEIDKYAAKIKERINIQKLDSEDIIYNGGKVIIPAYLAKGLEFDGVIIIEEENVQPLVKYIMCTRALHRLAVIKTKN